MFFELYKNHQIEALVDDLLQQLEEWVLGCNPLTRSDSGPLTAQFCNVGNGEDGFEPARRTDGLSAIQSAD